ncbi:hypothetical protein [Salmonella sp. S152_61454]|uniref:hypothetical protein n=1 Tax=Salmonella sp. S152_61454 TaxID=2665641 RepID=UPI001659759E
MAQYGGEQNTKQEGHHTDEHAQNPLHSTTAGHDVGGTGTNMGMGGGHGCKEGKQGVVEKIKEKLPGGDHGADKHTTHASDPIGGGEYGNVGEEGHEKKGLAGKIKDKLPGGGSQ